MRIKAAALAALAVAALGAGGALAQSVDAADPEGVLAAVRAFGHKARLETDPDGLPVIRARMDDINYAIQFYGCEGTANCRQLQLAASFDLEPGLTPEFVNQWNEDWAIGRLSVDQAGDPIFTYFLVTDGGLSPANFRAVLEIWSAALGGVVGDIGY